MQTLSSVRSGAGRGRDRPCPGGASRNSDASKPLNVRPPHISTDKSVPYDYPIVYVRVPRPYPKEYCHLNHLNQAGLHQTNAPGAELRLLHPDGRDESLVAVGPRVHHRSGGFVRWPVGLLRQVPRDGHQGRGPHDPDTQPPGVGHLQGSRAHAQGGSAHPPEAHAQHRGRTRGE